MKAGGLRGKREMEETVKKISRVTPKRIGAALKRVLNVEKREVVARTPKDSGKLASTVRVTDPFTDGDRIGCEMLAGDETTDYALIVHEDLEAYHDTGQAKFMESVLNEVGPHMNQRVARELRIEDFLS